MPGTPEYEKKCIGIAGIGGLGTMGIKLAKSFGHKVVAISSTEEKNAMAKEKGADKFVSSESRVDMELIGGTLDLILNTNSDPHSVQNLMTLLKPKGTIVNLGAVS